MREAGRGGAPFQGRRSLPSAYDRCLTITTSDNPRAGRDRNTTRWLSLASIGLVIAIACSGPDGPTPPPLGSDPGESEQPAAPLDGRWFTYHADAARSGVAQGPSLANARRAWTSARLDADIYAEPLVVGGNVIAATQNNSVYALDGSTGTIVWRTNLGPPVDSSTLPCGNIAPTSGITGTPVLDPSTGLLYAVAFLAPGHHELFALRERTGDIVWSRGVDPPGMDPLTHQLRAALTLANEHVYVAFGGLFGDCGSYHGWVAGVGADGSGPLRDYQVPTENAGGIWAPSGPAADGDGNLFVATGNSFSGTAFDFGDSVIKLSPQLERLDFFSPQDWAELNVGDVDLGSTGPAVLSMGRIFQIGKGGVGYLLDAEHLGGIGGELASHQVCDGAFGGTAHSLDAVYVPCRDGLVALSVAADGGDFTRRWRSAEFSSGPPIVAGGLVWTVDLSSDALVGLGVANGDEVVRLPVGESSHFASPSASSGCLFVPTVRTVTAFCG